MSTAERLLAALRSAKGWPEDVDAMEAIQAAARSGAALSSVVPELVARLGSADAWSAEAAAETLGLLGDEAAVEALCDVLKGAAPALPADLGPRPAHAAYAHAVVAVDEDNLRCAVIRALQAIGSEAAVPILRTCADAPDEADRVRSAAREALERCVPARMPGTHRG